MKNPVIIIANYIFDRLPHDIFQVRPHTLSPPLPPFTPCPDTHTHTHRGA